VNPIHDLIKQHSPFLNAKLLCDPDWARKKKTDSKPHTHMRLTRLTLDSQSSPKRTIASEKEMVIQSNIAVGEEELL